MARKTTSNASSKRKSTGAAKTSGAAASKDELAKPSASDAVAEENTPKNNSKPKAASSEPSPQAKSRTPAVQRKSSAKPAPQTAKSVTEKDDAKAAAAKVEEKAADKVEPNKPAAGAKDGSKPEAKGDVKPDTEAGAKPETQSAPVHPVPSVPAPSPEKKRSALPAIFAGLVAGVIGGAGASYYFATNVASYEDQFAEIRSETETALSAQQERLDALQAEIAANVPDLSGIEAAQTELESTLGDLTERVSGAEGSLDALGARLSELQQETLASALSEDAIAAYEAEFSALQEAMVVQRAEIEAMTEEARQLETSAEETAQATMRRAALSRIQTALDAGGSYADALADLKSAGATVPASLEAGATDGIVTLANLQESFPNVARAALSAARDEAAQTGDTDGATAFFRNVLGARSLEPREGSDPDAVLSRAEAAVRENRLRDALAEIETLPDGASAAVSDWAARAEERLAAIEAAQSLSEELN